METLKQQVYEANMLLVKYNLVIHTWGNVSQISRDRTYYVIKPSGVSYQTLKADDMVVVDLQNNVIQGHYNPSTDTPTHSIIYKYFDKVQAIVHTHSTYATSFAQAGVDIKCYGTTHADNFFGNVPCLPSLTKQEISGEYEKNTGKKIVTIFENQKIDYAATPACLIKEHGPFCWSLKNAKDAADLALTLEQVAKMAFLTQNINPLSNEAQKDLQLKHYYRKHGKNAYYGQKDK
ncbi:MAG: L-ribulose-5-phosphate 4-epimerase [Malacoplasma sp.]|nr:L-ribulose-5-phosphate 4-epimerase [Malacoplasma sp.]